MSGGDLPADEIRAALHRAADIAADYLEGIEERRVLPEVRPGEVAASLPERPPRRAEPLDAILDDYERLILPALTHWNHPGFMAYFGITGSAPGIIGDLLAASTNVNAMLWRTSPAATELEERTCDWLRDMLGLPPGFAGHINDTASIATFLCLAAARHRDDPEVRRRGARFRALKLWMVLRAYGVEGLAERLREHCELAAELAAWLDRQPGFELVLEPRFSVVCFRLIEPARAPVDAAPADASRPDAPDSDGPSSAAPGSGADSDPAGPDPVSEERLSEAFLEEVHRRGSVFLSSSRLAGRPVLRVAIGNIKTGRRHVEALRDLLLEAAEAARRRVVGSGRSPAGGATR